jgi:Carboxypeptidase regulatory-like domain
MKNLIIFKITFVVHGLRQLCILLVIIFVCSTAYAQTNREILLDSPDDGTVLALHDVWEFNWSASGFKRFKVEFSTDEQFKRIVYRVHTKSLNITLRQGVRKKLFRLARKNDGILFWRVIGKSYVGNVKSEPGSFFIEQRYSENGKFMGFIYQSAAPGYRHRIPIPGAHVLLFETIDTNKIPVSETTTSRSGKYLFDEVPFGDYIVVVEKEGYTSFRETVTVWKRGPSPRKSITKLNIGLHPFLEPESLWSGVNNADIFDEPGPMVDEMLDQLDKANLRVLRVIIDYRLEMDEDGHPLPLHTYNDCVLNWIDRLMIKTNEKGILLLITLQDHNWIRSGKVISISKENYEWRRCKTPYNLYQISLSKKGKKQTVAGPYAARGWSDNYLTSIDARNAYKERVSHILNHYNHHFKKKWKDMNDVIWAWALHSEPGLLPNSPVNVLHDWFDEMATYVKSIDPDTYVVLGTKFLPTDLGNIEDADIYTIHAYDQIDRLDKDIQDFQEQIGTPYGKLLLVEEFNPGAGKKYNTPDYPEYRADFEFIMEVCRKHRVPWMFWEHGYNGNNFDRDDIWHANSVNLENGKEHFDGVFWGAKLLPGAKRIWQTVWDWSSVGKPWKVHKIVDNNCAMNFACATSELYFIDTFSGDTFSSGQLSNEYDIFDEGTKDSYVVTTGSPHEYGYLRIEAHEGQNLWYGTSGAPLVLHDVPVLKNSFDFYSVEAFVSADPLPGLNAEAQNVVPLQSPNTEMGLFVFQNVDNWIFFGLARHEFTIGNTNFHQDGLILTLTKNGTSSIVAIDPIAVDDFVFLKIDHRADGLWRFSWKRENGEPWDNWWVIPYLDLKNHKVGMGVKTLEKFQPLSSGHANFDYFLIRETRRN